MYSRWFGMEIKGRRVSGNEGCKIHIFDEGAAKTKWDSYCGKRISSKHSFPLEPVDENSCCAICWNRYHHNLRVKANVNSKG